jgi:hypothetical protein
MRCVHDRLQRGGHVDIRKKLVIGSVTLVALAGLGSTAAMASKSKAPVKAPKTAMSEPIETTDTDNVQEGDQTTPDSPALAPLASFKAASSSSKSTSSANPAEGETSVDGESQTESDGPGGHEDPPGNVDYQFEGEQ